MDFFEHQDVARRNTGRLIALFLAAVAGIVVMVYGLVITFFVFRLDNRITSLWQPQIFLNTTVAVLGVIAAGSLWKIKQLGRGGAAIAQRIGGRLLDPASTDPLERRVLNLVEEMAIASGTPVPPVYMLDEERSINAFAAGRHSSDAVIGVTRGAVMVLDREELQGVIAHEFSHVFHGDSELNLQLIGIIHGIELIGLAGRMMLHGTPRRARGRKGGAPIVVGAALMLIGSIGSLFGNLIRSAVSKQREFLADASAVQFTRNAGGVAGALKKIGGYGFGSHLGHPARAELSHMFFGSGLPGWDLAQLFSTHPRIEERIRRVDPSFDGKIPVVPLEFVSHWGGDAALAGSSPAARSAAGADARKAQKEEVADAVSQFTTSALRSPTASAAIAGLAALGALGREEIGVFAAGSGARKTLEGGRARPKPLLERLGDPGPDHLAYAQELVASLSPALREASHDPIGARVLCYALLGGADTSVRAAQERRVEQREGREVVERVRVLRAELEKIGPEARLPLSDMLAGTLKGLDAGAYQGFRKLAHELVEEDGRVDLAEWVLAGLLLHRLDAHFTPKRARSYRYSRFQGLSNELIFLLSTLAHAANADPARARQAFEAAARELELRGAQPSPLERCTPRVIEAALGTLVELAPRLKKRLLAACAASIAADEVVTTAEAELFRVVADWLDCPAPPLLPGQKLA